MFGPKTWCTKKPLLLSCTPLAGLPHTQKIREFSNYRKPQGSFHIQKVSGNFFS